MCAFIWKWPVIFRFVIVRYMYCYCYSLVHMYIYIYIYKYICIHVYIYIYVCVYMYVCIHTYPFSYYTWNYEIMSYIYYIYVSYLSCILYVKINGEWWDKWLTCNLNIKQKVKLEQLYKVGSKCVSNLWHNSWVGTSVWSVQ